MTNNNTNTAVYVFLRESSSTLSQSDDENDCDKSREVVSSCTPPNVVMTTDINSTMSPSADVSSSSQPTPTTHAIITPLDGSLTSEALANDSIASDDEPSSIPPTSVHTDDSLDGDRSLPALDHLDDEDERAFHSTNSDNRSLVTSPRRILAVCGLLWVFQLFMVIALKRCGLVEPEFRPYEAVKQGATSVLPALQLEQMLLSRFNMTGINESMMYSVPGLGYLTQEKKRPGFHLSQLGAAARYPVVMVPGFVTSGLEVWAGKECAKKHFRQRYWAAMFGARSFIMERDCWKEHTMLDPITGGDPEGVKLRAASGFEAADYFLGSYWVWAKLIENLADVGYTPSTMTMAPYDWRLAFPLLEERDGYFTKLKSAIEDMHKTAGEKVVLTSHSMGALVVHYFFAWVTTKSKHGGGGGGRDWVDKHIHAYVNIAGSHLGVPKAATALLSGEMSDTVMLGMMGDVVERFFGRKMRRDLWISWGSLWTMLPKGGDTIWGVGADMCSSRSEDDPLCPVSEQSPLLALSDFENKQDEESGDHNSVGIYFDTNRSSVCIKGSGCKHSSSLEDTVNKFLMNGRHSTQDVLQFLRSYPNPQLSGSRLVSLSGIEDRPSGKTWHDPTRTPLPHAPSMRIYCMYGTGIDTERAYHYTANHHGEDPPIMLDTSQSNETYNVKYGVRFSDGDGSVPLISLGYICHDRWNDKRSGLNPSSIPITTREYKHQQEFTVDDPMRKGPRSSDHVDILGNVDMTEDLLRVVTGFDTKSIEDNLIISDIEKISAEINTSSGGAVLPKRKWWSRFIDKRLRLV